MLIDAVRLNSFWVKRVDEWCSCDKANEVALERLFLAIFINFQQSRITLKRQGTSHNTRVYVFDMGTRSVCVSYRSVGGNAI